MIFKTAFAVFLSGCLCCAAALPGAVIHVDNVKGNDKNDGSAERPVASIERGIALLKTSGRLEVAPNGGKPYMRPYPGANGAPLDVKVGGSPEKPLVLNGNGAVLSGLAAVPADRWKKVSDRIYTLPFWPMSNLYKNDMKQDYWLPALKIWFINGKSAPNMLSRNEMEKHPGSFWWSRKERVVYFHLPDKRKLEELKIELPANNGFYTHKDHTVIQNFSFIQSWNDGFDTASTPRGTVYRDCIAVDNCGQGFSCHGSSSALYIDCIAIRNGSAGACNVHNSSATYLRCLFFDNVFEAGVFTANHSTSRFHDSLILANRPFEQIWAHGNGSFFFENCVVSGAGESRPLLFLRHGSMVFYRSTLTSASNIAAMHPANRGTLRLEECLVGETKGTLFQLPFPLSDRIQFINNLYFRSAGIRIGSSLYVPAQMQEYGAANKFDSGSRWDNSLKNNPATGVPDAVRCKSAGGRDLRIGAILPPELRQRLEKYRNVKTGPAGISFPQR